MFTTAKCGVSLGKSVNTAGYLPLMVEVVTDLFPEEKLISSLSPSANPMFTSFSCANVFEISPITRAGTKTSFSPAVLCHEIVFVATLNLSVAMNESSLLFAEIITAVRTGVTSSLEAATET